MRCICLLMFCLTILAAIPTRGRAQALVPVEVATEEVVEEVVQDVADAVVAGEEVDVEVVDLEALEWVELNQANEPYLKLVYRYAKVQVAFVSRVCELSDDQLADLKTIDKKWVDAKLAEVRQRPQQKGLMRGVLRFLGGQQPAPANRQLQPQELIPRLQTVIDNRVNELLDEAQRAEFAKEVEAKQEFRSQAQAALILAALDRHVFFSAEQRQALSKDVADWIKKEKLDLYCQFYFQNPNYVPDVPMRVMKEHLSEDQVSALNGMNRWNYNAVDMEWQMIQHQGADFVIED